MRNVTLNRLLIFSVFVVASCGLAYELIAGALASYLLGDSVLQFSSIIGCYLFAMGVGSHCARYVRDADVMARFIDVEMLVGLLGGISAALLFGLFVWMSAPFRVVLYALVFFIGFLVGMEIPLVMRALNARQAQFSELVSRVLSFDYLGALAVSLLFPLVLAPRLGLARSAFLFGVLNVGIALLTLHHFRAEVARARAVSLRGWALLALLLAGFVFAERFTSWAEQSLFSDPIVHAQTSPYQRMVLTRWHDETRLYLNGNLQFSSRDEYRYHEALVHPALAALPTARKALVLGGGDGLALRELLKYPQLQQVTLVDLDPAMTELFSTAPELVKLNAGALLDRRVRVVNADAAQWLEHHDEVFDAIIVDLPDPSNFALGKLYSVPLYRLMKQRLSADGYLVVQSTSPWYAPHAYWCIVATLRAAGLHTWPYHLWVPAFGDWGYVLAGQRADYTPPAHIAVPTRFLDAAGSAAMFRFAPDMRAPKVAPNTLNSQRLVHYFEQDWRRAQR